MSAPTCGDRWGRGEIGAALSRGVRAYPISTSPSFQTFINSWSQFATLSRITAGTFTTVDVIEIALPGK